MHIKYLPEYTNIRFPQVHPVNHPAWVSHVTSNLVTYVLFSYNMESKGLSFINPGLSHNFFYQKQLNRHSTNLIKCVQLSFQCSSSSCDLCFPLPFIYLGISERGYPVQKSWYVANQQSRKQRSCKDETDFFITYNRAKQTIH